MAAKALVIEMAERGEYWSTTGHEFLLERTDGSTMPSGVYFCQLKAGAYFISQRIVLVK